MTMLATNSSVNYDGTSSPITATGPVIVTFSGTHASFGEPSITVYTRTDTARFVNALQVSGFQRLRLDVASGEDFYIVTDNITSADSFDLSVIDA